MIVQLQSAGVTTAIMLADPVFPLFQLNEAKAQNYFPEWVWIELRLHRQLDRAASLRRRRGQGQLRHHNAGRPGRLRLRGPATRSNAYHRYPPGVAEDGRALRSEHRGRNEPRLGLLQGAGRARALVLHDASCHRRHHLRRARPHAAQCERGSPVVPADALRRQRPDQRSAPGAWSAPATASTGSSSTPPSGAGGPTTSRLIPEKKEQWVEYPDCQRHYTSWKPEALAVNWERGGPNYAAWCGAANGYPRLN